MSSHKNVDATIAKHISDYLSTRGISNYLDVMDSLISGNGEQLTTHLRKRLNECTHLLAVLSISTKDSWWVPFEIGLATERDYPISSFSNISEKSLIPDYLWKWPILRNPVDMDRYIAVLRKDSKQLLSEEVSKSKSIYATSQPKNYAEAFHKRMKADLNQ